MAGYDCLFGRLEAGYQVFSGFFGLHAVLPLALDT